MSHELTMGVSSNGSNQKLRKHIDKVLIGNKQQQQHRNYDTQLCLKDD